ncbi:hypothetical protein LPJ61_005093 [Coemansia biformis]|uniref:Uncharacterized protein n=1 Tax=Coemansia biformis TaxID=1286918 RepID=A0A9W7Y9F9_9FUNG|nr:hypothetical protein LPJ61_005093 [Coemansia biformis]
MLRRFGESLSPTEPQRHLEAFGRSSGQDPFAGGSKSPPKPGMASIRSISSGSAGSVVTGRSVLGVAPFKSPSVSDSPGLGVGVFADISTLAALADSDEAGRAADDASRRRGYAVGPGGSLREAGALAEMQQHAATKVPGSPSSTGTSASGHSRRLSSSFGNRRATTVLRRPSILGMSATERPGTAGAGAAPHDGAGVSRRHTIVEGQIWSTAAGGSEQQDIGDFIHMIDTKRPLKTHGLKSPPATQRSRDGAAGSPLDRSALSISTDAVTSADVERLHGRPPSEPLRKYQDILYEFNGLSQDMEGSVLSHGRAIAATREDMTLGSMADEEVAESPFRRAAIPNPLRSSGDRTGASRPSSMVAAAPAPAPAAVAPVDESSNMDLLRQAFDGMAIESLRGIPDARSAATTQLPPISPRTGRAHVRSAAPGLDPESERPLPPPVVIPHQQHRGRTASEHARPQRRQTQAQASPDLDQDRGDDEEDEVLGPQGPVHFMRGKSHPVTHIAKQGPGFAQHIAIAHAPQPLPTQLHSLVSRAPPGRTGPDAGPLSFRSDFAAGGSRLGALLGAVDDRVGAAKAPRSTPSTPSQAPSAILSHGNGSGSGESDSSEKGWHIGGARFGGDQLRSNFPPLSFILPRSRVQREEKRRPSGGRSGAGANQREDASGSHTDDDDLMFQMDASVH